MCVSPTVCSSECVDADAPGGAVRQLLVDEITMNGVVLPIEAEGAKGTQDGRVGPFYDVTTKQTVTS